MMQKTLISLLAILLLAACSTPHTRSQRHAELMASLSPEERAKVEAGEIDLGFTEEMVHVALGKPDRTYTTRTEDGEQVVWAYHAGGLSRLSVGVGTSIGTGSRGTGYGGGVAVGSGGRPRAEERLRVAFSGGRVIGIEQSER